MTVTMQYGSYNFSPVPMITINKEPTKMQNGDIIGVLYKLTLNGTITNLPSGDGGIVSIDTKQDELLAATSGDGERFLVQCDSTTLIDVYPRINSISFNESNDNWVYQSPYTIEIEFDVLNSGSDPGSPYLRDASESWNIEFGDHNQWTLALSGVADQQGGYNYGADCGFYDIRLSHTINAVGKAYYDASGTQPAWQEARKWVQSKAGLDWTIVADSGSINFETGNFTAFNHVRTVSVDEPGGSYSMTENWLLLDVTTTGVPGNATEEFTIETRKPFDSDITTVNINGTIQGLDTRTYGSDPGDFTFTEDKFTAASGYWNQVKTKLYPRCQLFVQDDITRALNTNVMNRTVGYNAPQGTISYNYEYNDRPSNCIAGSLTESISINDTNPTDVITELVIPGRTAGPILQPMNTYTKPQRDVSVEVVMAPSTGCTASTLFATNPRTAVAALLCSFETELSGAYDQVFKVQDQESWNPKEGRYSRNISWTYLDCSTALSVTLC